MSSLPQTDPVQPKGCRVIHPLIEITIFGHNKHLLYHGRFRKQSDIVPAICKAMLNVCDCLNEVYTDPAKYQTSEVVQDLYHIVSTYNEAHIHATQCISIEFVQRMQDTEIQCLIKHA